MSAASQNWPMMGGGCLFHVRGTKSFVAPNRFRAFLYFTSCGLIKRQSLCLWTKNHFLGDEGPKFHETHLFCKITPVWSSVTPRPISWTRPYDAMQRKVFHKHLENSVQEVEKSGEKIYFCSFRRPGLSNCIVAKLIGPSDWTPYWCNFQDERCILGNFAH